MDQELIAYLDESFRSLRDYVDQRFERVEVSVRGLRDEMDLRFEKVEESVRGLRDEMDLRFEKVEESVRGLRDEMDLRFEKVTEEIRHTQILVEAGRGDIRMVAEGTYSLDERLGFFRKEVQQEFEDVRKLIRPVYSSLDQRIRTLEVRKDLQGRDPIELIKERFGLGQKPE